MQRFTVRLIFFALFASFAHAQPGTHWLELKTPNFTVLTNSGEHDARRVASQFERMRTLFHVVLPSATDDPATPIVVLALKDRKSFRTLEPAAYLGKNQLELAGLFVRAQDRNYVLLRLDSEGDHPFATVYHEYTHYMLRRYEDWLPLWLNEGLAEFYQNTQLEDKDVRLGQPSEDDILYLRQSKLLPLATLLTVDHNSPFYHDEQKGSVFYSESWALTHYLEVSDKDNKTRHLTDYMVNVQQRHQDSLTAAQNAFGDLKTLERNLDNYISGMSFKEFRLLTPVTFSEASFTVRPLPDSEADSIRAGVLLNVQRKPEAEALLQSALQADPKSALAHETMGALKFSEHDIEGARKWFGEAVQLDSKSYLAQYYFGVMSLQGGGQDQDEAIEKALKTSIQLNSRFAPSYDALARFYAERHEKLDEAHLLNLHAIQLEPESLPYRLNSANVLEENRQMEAAVAVLKTALPVAKTPDEKQMVEGRIAQIEQYQRSLTDAEARQRAQPADTVSSNVSATTESGGKVISFAPRNADITPPYPAGEPGTHHTVSGVLHGVKCSYPNLLTLTLDRPGNPLALYSNNYFKVLFTTPGDTSNEPLQPCNQMEGKKARVEYGDVTDTRVAGQILSIELNK